MGKFVNNKYWSKSNITMAYKLPDSLVKEHLGGQSTEHQQLQSSHEQAI